MSDLLKKSGALGAAATLAGGATGAMLLALAAPAGATAATYTVDTLSDGARDAAHCTDSIPGNCTLRDAVEAGVLANTTGTVVEFASGLTGTITLTNGELEVGADMSIVGPGADVLTVSGNNSSTVFYFCASTGAQISGLTITGGNAPQGAALYEESCSPLTVDSVVITGNTSTGGGGAIYTQDNLTIRNSIVTNNTSGTGAGMYVDGDLVMEGTVVSGNTSSGDGGGIYVTGTASITTSTIGGNTAAANGGAIAAGGSLTIANSTLSGNSAGGHGGGVAVTGNGTVLIANSTITGNSGSVGGGLDAIGNNDVTLDQDTIVGNSASSTDALYSGGGIHFGNPLGAISLSGTIASGNTSAAGPADVGFGNTNASTGSITATNSLLGGVDSRLTVGGSGNITATDPGVAALSDNGGPTKTMVLLATSPALDAGPSPVATFPGNEFDQRGVGFPRILGTKADIGAVEGTGAPAPTPTPDPLTPAFTG
jgi:predicted outer membrane repeat protein